ncbi:MAG: 3-deoxy-7-phosphoheptulonate synthase [Acidobacteriota bacterium]|nr:MAG: 3-deoxy-7-phosphoheptulonate synthase [Acidobacteriota bacterium]
MLIVMDSMHTDEQLETVVKKIEGMGFKAHVIPGAQNVAVGVTGNPGALDPGEFEILPGVKQALRVTRPYKLPGRDFKRENTVFRVGKASMGGSQFVVIAGPCAVETEEQTVRIARFVARAGAHWLRGGAYKPRTSPYSFQGLGEEGLKILAAAREETGLPVVTEVLDQRSLEKVVEYADVLQIGTRNMQNFALLREVGEAKKPVMLKRGFSATIDEWLQAAEYLLSGGTSDVFLCERGIRTFSSHTRNTLDLSAVPVVKQLSHLPVIVDPSHGVGARDKVIPMSRAAAAVGAHGIMLDVHDRPEEALCDGPQALLPDQFTLLMRDLRAMSKALGFEL